jgi:hypothetical protein
MLSLELLDQQIRHHEFGLSGEPRTLMINSEWVEGSTLPPKPVVTKARRGRRRSR